MNERSFILNQIVLVSILNSYGLNDLPMKVTHGTGDLR